MPENKEKETFTIKVLYSVNGTFCNKKQWIEQCNKVDSLFYTPYSKCKYVVLQPNKKIIHFNLEY